MSYNIKDLLVLPTEEKIAIADLLYSSVNEELNEEESLTPWYEDEEFVNELDKEFEAWKRGEVKGYTIDEVKNFMEEQKAKYRNK